MSERAICGKRTVEGPPCQNGPGCTANHPSPASSGAHSAARSTAVQAATAEALHDQADTPASDQTMVRLQLDLSDNEGESWSERARSASVDVEVFAEWQAADREFWGRRPDEDPAAPAFEIIDCSDEMIRRLGAERQDFIEARYGLSFTEAEAVTDRWIEACIDMRTAVAGPRPESTATITYDFGNCDKAGPGEASWRDPASANCEMKSEDGRTTLDIEDLHQGRVLLNMRHVPEHLGWGHSEPEVGWHLTEDEARVLVAELGHRFGWD